MKIIILQNAQKWPIGDNEFKDLSDVDPDNSNKELDNLSSDEDEDSGDDIACEIESEVEDDGPLINWKQVLKTKVLKQYYAKFSFIFIIHSIEKSLSVYQV